MIFGLASNGCAHKASLELCLPIQDIVSLI